MLLISKYKNVEQKRKQVKFKTFLKQLYKCSYGRPFDENIRFIAIIIIDQNRFQKRIRVQIRPFVLQDQFYTSFREPFFYIVCKLVIIIIDRTVSLHVQ